MKKARHHLTRVLVFAFFFAVSAIACGGCNDSVVLMPTPNVYAQQHLDPFDDVPADHRTNRVEVMYLTDRKPEACTRDWQSYGYRRSRSLVYGVSEVEFGEDLSWAKLAQASHNAERSKAIRVHVRKVREL